MTWTFSRMMDLATGYWRSGALAAGVELGLFEALADGGLPEEALASRLGASDRHVRELVQALRALGLLQRSGGRLVLDPGAAPFLDPASPTCLLDALRFNADLMPLWARLADAVRRGEPALPPGAHLGSDPERTRRFAMGMNSRAMALAPHLLRALDLPGEGSLLDLACGAGTFSRLWCEAHPGWTATQFDLPAVLDVARELAGRSAASDRIGFHAGHYLRDELGGPYDAVLYIGALHQETPARGRALFDRIAGALRPGGRFVVADLMLAADRSEPAFTALFSLTMMLTSPDGRVFDTDETAAMLRAAGFSSVRSEQLPDVPYAVLHARRTP